MIPAKRFKIPLAGEWEVNWCFLLFTKKLAALWLCFALFGRPKAFKLISGKSLISVIGFILYNRRRKGSEV